jgi:hypothetical protein
MMPMHILNAVAQKESAKQAILKQLREHGATSVAMPGSVEAEGDDAKAALAELLAGGEVHETPANLYYLDETKAKTPRPGNGFVALLAILVIVSIAASMVALAATAT